MPKRNHFDVVFVRVKKIVQSIAEIGADGTEKSFPTEEHEFYAFVNKKTVRHVANESKKDKGTMLQLLRNNPLSMLLGRGVELMVDSDGNRQHELVLDFDDQSKFINAKVRQAIEANDEEASNNSCPKFGSVCYKVAEPNLEALKKEILSVNGYIKPEINEITIPVEDKTVAIKPTPVKAVSVKEPVKPKVEKVQAESGSVEQVDKQKTVSPEVAAAAKRAVVQERKPMMPKEEAMAAIKEKLDQFGMSQVYQLIESGDAASKENKAIVLRTVRVQDKTTGEDISVSNKLLETLINNERSLQTIGSILEHPSVAPEKEGSVPNTKEKIALFLVAVNDIVLNPDMVKKVFCIESETIDMEELAAKSVSESLTVDEKLIFQ